MWHELCVLPVRTIAPSLQPPSQPLGGKAASEVELALWAVLWAGSGLCVAFQTTAGSERGQHSTLTPLWAQAQAGTGKQPELWSGCVMAAPQWCDRHMIFPWCLLLKDKDLA